jgi:outer membrane protein
MAKIWQDTKCGIRMLLKLSRPHLMCRLVVTTLVVITFGGCAASSIEKETTTKALKDKLDKIDTVQLAEHSSTPPVTVEQATEQITRQVAEPNESRKTITLSLDQVRAYALENYLDLKVELVSPSIAQSAFDEEQAKFESVLFGSTGIEHAETVDTGDVSELRASEVGIEKPLPTGGSIGVSVPFSEGDYDSGGLAEAAISFSYIQSLLRGAGTRINTQSIRIAGHQWNIISARTKLAAIYLLANADIAYWRLYAARKELDVRHEQYKLAQNQLSYARKMVVAGSAPKIEIVRAEAGLASRLEAVISAETTVQSRVRDLQRIMNRSDIPMEVNTDIMPLTEPNPLGLELDKEALAEQALENRMDIIELEQLLTIDDLSIELARNAILPDLTVNYTYAGRTRGRSLGSTLEDLTRGTFDDHSVSLSAAIPLGNEAAKARLQAARLTRKQDLARRERLRQIIRQDVYEAVSELDKNWRRILAAEQGVTAAERDYSVEQSQFQLGRRTSTDVLFAVTRLADAQLSKIRALVDYEIAQINLARATGTLLGHGQIYISSVSIDSGNF